MNVLIQVKSSTVALGVEMMLERNFDHYQIYMVTNAEEAIDFIQNNEVQLILTDSSIPIYDMEINFRRYREIKKDIQILVLGDRCSKPHEFQFIKSGASGFVSKNCTEDQIVSAIQLVISGQIYMSQNALIHQNEKSKDGFLIPVKKLSKREYEVFKHLVDGQTVNGICELLGVKQSTVSTLKTRVMKKIEVNSLAGLIKKAKDYGYTES